MLRLFETREHIAMIRKNTDGSKTPLTLPNYSKIKGSTLRTICTQAGISRDEFLNAYPTPRQKTLFLRYGDEWRGVGLKKEIP
jgi:hypothetical protein